jgi:hypothetical protein
MRKLSFPAFCLSLLALAASALAQEHYTEGPVWRVTYLDVKPGKMNDALKDLRMNFNKVNAEAKVQGLILDYKVYLNATSTGPTDWDIAVAILYKNFGAIDGLTAKMDPITLKHYGSAESRQQATVSRLELWTVLSSALAREISMKP